MPHRSPMLKAFTTVLLLVAITTTTWAQSVPGALSQDAAFLRAFDGQFTGTGRLERANGSDHALTCEFKGNSVGRQAVFDGRCTTAIIFGISMRISIRYDAGTRRYFGSFHESMGTIALCCAKVEIHHWLSCERSSGGSPPRAATPPHAYHFDCVI